MNQPVVGGLQWRAILDGFVVRQKLLDQRVDLLEAADAGAGRVPVAVVGVVDQFRQRQQQTQVIVDILGRAVLFQLRQHFDHLEPHPKICFKIIFKK